MLGKEKSVTLLTTVVIDALNTLTRDLFGYETYGYWPWHNSEEAVKACDEHVSSR